MERFAQVGIAIGALGVVLALMGLFPGLTGVQPTPGIGIVQVTMLLTGYGLLLMGGLIYAKSMFYLGQAPNLWQQIGTRLALTGWIFAALSGFADLFNFGSHLRTETSDIFFGQLQGLGLIASFGVAAFGVLLYVLGGQPRLPPDEMTFYDDQLPIDDAVSEPSDEAPASQEKS
ncbi:MAG: hypothetical protein NZ750_12740 [Anaerolineae bacterium]|nr:hypothetical protein [Anaerolineae bacterium]MDW8173642.1 hypothetical protein [Anaerolineae bacterium]